MKKSQNTKSVAASGACCSRRQKIYGVIALGGLFACGMMVGLAINGGGNAHKNVNSALHEEQCESLANEILGVINTWDDIDLGKLKDLNDIYAANCDGYVPKSDRRPKSIDNVIESQSETCDVIESMMLQSVTPDKSLDAGGHANNIEIYNKLIKYGCPENVEKYQKLIQHEQEILMFFDSVKDPESTDENSPCKEIEKRLLNKLPSNLDESWGRIERAKIYANLSERGCPENSQRYVDLASKELEVARALEDDRFNEYATEEVVETYKRLEMKQAASEVLNKVQKLTDPAIDFILKMEQIINE